MIKFIEFLGLIFIVFLGFFIKHVINRKKQPPGPLGLPFFGIKAFQLLQFFFPKWFPPLSVKEYFKQMKKKYGNFWSVDEGNKTVFVLASIELFNEAFVDNGKLFSGRPSIEFFKIFSEQQGLFAIDGEVWQLNRQLAIKSLRELGMGKQILENFVRDEVDEFIETLENSPSKTFESPTMFIKVASNVIAKLNFNIRNEYNDPAFDDYIKNLHIIGHSSEATNIMELFKGIIPMRFTRVFFPNVDEFIKATDKCMKFIENKCRDRLKVEGEFTKPGCIFDFFWRYRYQDNPEIKSEEKLFNIKHTMFDMMFAGTDSVNNILGFSFLFLGKDKELQDDLRNELKSLVDNYKLINMECRKQCPKMLSFIDEILRFCPLDDFLFRRTISDCVFRGYKIRSNDTVYGDLKGIMSDPENFENPDVFNAYRFMDKSRTKYVPSKCIFTFGIGKRACPGEGMSMMEVFLFLSKLLLKFDVSFTKKTESNFDTILKGTEGLVYCPLAHELIFTSLE